MEKAKVYFSDFRTVANGDGLTNKLKKMIRKAGIGEIDMEGKFVAIKMHFGERGNLSFLRPNYARAVAEVVKELGGKPYLTDCNTLYVGSRKNALEHLECAWENGFTALTVGCPILIADGLRGTDDVLVPVEGGEYVKNATPCSMCRRLIINAGITRVVIRNTKTEYSAVDVVRDWVDADEEI